MSYRVINLPGAELEGSAYCDVYDRELEVSLSEGARGVALVLKPEMGACVELVEWLARWKQVFAEQHRQIVIVASDPRQQQYLDLSHPDQQLTYVSSMEELRKKFPSYSPSQAPAAQTDIPAPPPPIEEEPIPKPPEAEAPSPEAVPPEVQSAPPVQTTPPPPPAPPPVAERPAPPKEWANEEAALADIRIQPEDVVRLSGEYTCLGCGMTRMYAKGDTSIPCKNPECMYPKMGWKLVFELF